VGDVVTFVAGPDTSANSWARVAEGGWTRLQGERPEEPRSAAPHGAVL
jgi:hypothetical protein